MTIRKVRIIAVLLLSACIAPAMTAQEVPAGLAQGVRQYQAADYAAALESFRQATPSSPESTYAGYAEFWVARTLMALNRYAEAADAFDLFLSEYASHPYREEASYQRARLFYLDEEYEASIQRFNDFLQAYPESDFRANSIYWSGEALFALGNLDEARRFFEEVTERYPTSFRVEAARYRLDIIDLKRRENELLTLLQWSHEEYLASLEEFRQKELAYQEALTAYRDRLANLAEEDFREEIRVLNARVGELESLLAARDSRINELLAEVRRAEASTPVVTTDGADEDDGESSTAGAETSSSEVADLRSELLSLKAEALELQRRLIQEGASE